MTKQSVADIFTTAIECGIDTWSNITKYHWLKPDTGEIDVDGFFATITSPDGDWLGEKTINAETIVRGIQLIVNGILLPPNSVNILLEALGGDEDAVGQIDADIADAIVQAGLFGEIVYG